MSQKFVDKGSTIYVDGTEFAHGVDRAIIPSKPPDGMSLEKCGNWSASLTGEFSGTGSMDAMWAWTQPAPVEIQMRSKRWFYPTVIFQGCLLEADYDEKADEATLSGRSSNIVLEWKHWYARPVFWIWRQWGKVRKPVKKQLGRVAQWYRTRMPSLR